MAQLESSANQPKEAPAAAPTLTDANDRLGKVQVDLKAEQAKLPAGYRYDSNKGLVKVETTAAVPAAQESYGTRFLNWLAGAQVEQGGYVPSAASQEVKNVAAPFVPITNMVRGPADKKQDQ
ncbi:MAG: hypothetical protein AAB802_01890 [Patescibacteria group bacterium]